MSSQPQPDEQPINRAAEVLRHASDDDALELDHQDDTRCVRNTTPPSPQHESLRTRRGRLWRRYISLAVPHVACRDHLGEQLPVQLDQRTNILQQMNELSWDICAPARCSR